MAKSFKKVIACLLAVLMVLFSVPFTALANPTTLTPDINIRFGTLTNDYYDFAPDLSSGAWGAKDVHGTGQSGIYGPTLDYTGGVNEETGALEITKLSLDVTKAGPNIYVYNGEIEDPSEFADLYEGELQTDYTTDMGFTMTFTVANVDQLATLTGYFKYSDNIEPVVIYNSGTTNKNTVAKIGTKDDYDADSTSKKGIIVDGIIPNQDGNTFYGDFNAADNSTIGDGEIFLGAASDTGEAVPMASFDTSNDDAVVNPTTGELGYDFANDAIVITFGFIITGEISDSNPLVVDFSDKKGGYSGEETLECAYTGNDLEPEKHSRYATSPNAELSNKMYFMGYNANSKKYLNGQAEEPKEHVHTYDSVHTEATCSKNGYTTYTCNNSDGLGTPGDDVYTEEDDPATTLAHTPSPAVRENEVEATCSQEGSYDEVIKCSVCGEEISRTPKTIDKIAHTPSPAVRENEVEATCSQEGSYDEVVKCSVCGEEISRTPKTIDKIAHTPAPAVRENVVEATEDNEGSYDEVIKCSVCGEEISRDKKTIPPLSHTHSYTSEYTAPTCTSNGYTTYTCVKGDDTYVVYDEPDSTLEHTPLPAVRENEVEATCSQEGSYDEVIKCSVCGQEISRTPKTIDKIAHTPSPAVRENEVEATCSQEGSYDEVVKCSVCGEEISRTPKTIDKIAHTPAPAVRENEVEATVDNPGSYDEVIKCSVCGEEISRDKKTIPALEGVDVTIGNEYATFGDVDGLNVGTTKVAKGTEVTLTATPSGGCEFIGWEVDKKIVSTDSTYTFTAYTDVTIVPVFVDAESSTDNITVVFYDCYMNVTAAYTNVTVAEFQAAMNKGIPVGTTYAGKVFSGWSMSDDAIKALDHSATIEANYTDAVNDGYTVKTTDGAKFEDGTSEMKGVKYDTQVTVSADNATAWKINDVVVAYGSSYTFYVGSNVTVTPVTEEESVTAKPAVAMVSVDRVQGSHKVAFLATMSAADGYTIIDHGFVYGKGATDDELKIDKVGQSIAASGTKVKSASLTANSSNQFALNYGITAQTGTATAVAYITYKDAAGQITTDYTKVANGSYSYD